MPPRHAPGSPEGRPPVRDDALAIWRASLEAVRAGPLVAEALADGRVLSALRAAPRILVVGGGKAGAAMSEAVEAILADAIGRIEGAVNVPAECVRPLRAIRLHAARPAATNQPTLAGAEGTRRILDVAASAGPDDVLLCLLSGGGSALLPAPVDGVTLEEKQQVTALLHACGATINEMNAVRKHLSRIKGGNLARQFPGRSLVSLIISDVVGDPLDVIGSGPTAPDPTTFADALAVLGKYELLERAPRSIRRYLELGVAGARPETPKALPASVDNRVIGNNARALAAARTCAEALGYTVVNLGSFIQGEAREVARAFVGILRGIRSGNGPARPPVCVLSGGETTVTLGAGTGLGGRNQEFTLAAAHDLSRAEMSGVAVLSAGTDGEDGPTDAAGAVLDERVMATAEEKGLFAGEFLKHHDSYHFFERTGGLIKTGLTETNVMDVRVVLVRGA